MSAKILDGKKLASHVIYDLKEEIHTLNRDTGRVPRMVNVMIGDDHSTCTYAKSQKRVAAEVGIRYELKVIPAKTSQEEFVSSIKEINAEQDVNGILIHKPVPDHIQYAEAASFVDPVKDLEGINTINIGKMMLQNTTIIPCTPASVMEHLRSTDVALRGREVVIVGHSIIVGKPLSMLLLNQMATVTVCHVATSEAGHLEEHVKRADVLIVAVGKPALIKGEWIKPGAIVIDVGINRVENKIVGDVEYAVAERKAAFITPVPGGVGPVTVVMLMRNAIEAYKIQNNYRTK
jgi:methylenetetrahydrofolate dehydrogenase (NADP+)/methenyltetrahydrofolate cyclohydrolase